MNETRKKINQRTCYNRIWSWSPMPCEKHGPRASVTTKTSAFGLGFCLLSPSGHVFHTAWETMIKSYNISKMYSKYLSSLSFSPQIGQWIIITSQRIQWGVINYPRPRHLVFLHQSHQMIWRMQLKVYPHVDYVKCSRTRIRTPSPTPTLSPNMIHSLHWTCKPKYVPKFILKMQP